MDFFFQTTFPFYFSLGKAAEQKNQVNEQQVPGWEQASDYQGGNYYVDHANSK